MHSSVGHITESDVAIASAKKGAIIIGFNIEVQTKKIAQAAKANDVEIITSPIIYRLLEAIKEHMLKVIPSKWRQEVVGEARILQEFEISIKAGKKRIAGCRVVNGVLKRKAKVRLLRDGQCMFDGAFDSLKHVKKDIDEVSKGLECGISFDSFEEFKAGDLVQTYTLVEETKSL